MTLQLLLNFLIYEENLIFFYQCKVGGGSWKREREREIIAEIRRKSEKEKENKRGKRRK
jgi:hypothetical protein